ncbi:uncharacterized protein LOC132558555 [Ylistrum balloti]|uniref:uncharacterized protein LOC132558555 n=1 Tax=Ylistrum balloti TaxID=509963 RepID=UPI002905CC1D|nr:uncharacterized protein LOC132558555 [Ylistrum balloti]
MSLSGRNTFVSYIFEIAYVVHNTQDRLALCGSIGELGLWQLEDAVLAREMPPKSGTWFAAVELPPKSEFSWKWVVLNDQKHAVRWEERPPRNHRTGVYHGRLHTCWNGGETLSISQKQKFKHIGIDDAGDENEEESSTISSLNTVKLWTADEDIFAPRYSLPSIVSTHDIKPNHDEVSAQEVIRRQTLLEKSSTKRIETPEFPKLSNFFENQRRRLSEWVVRVQHFMYTLIEINYS